MELKRKSNKNVWFLLCIVGFYSQCVVLLKYKKGISITTVFKIFFNESSQRPNKIWIDKGNEFYNWQYKSSLQDNDIEMYSNNILIAVTI